MSLTPLTTESLKLQARRMRDHLAEKNIEISLAASLEILAKQNGFKDWNILSATLKRQELQTRWPALGDAIKGKYLGRPFTGKILKIEMTNLHNNRRYTIRFDEPIDVVTSDKFSNFRKQVNCILDATLKSVNHKGLPDNLVQLL